MIHDHVASGWQGFKTLKAIVADIAPGIAAAAFIPILIFAEVEILMILYNIVKEQIEARQSRRIEKVRAEGKAEGKVEGIAEGKVEGIAEGKVEGIAEGKALAQQEWHEWLERKEAAEAAGTPLRRTPTQLKTLQPRRVANPLVGACPNGWRDGLTHFQPRRAFDHPVGAQFPPLPIQRIEMSIAHNLPKDPHSSGVQCVIRFNFTTDLDYQNR